MKSHKSTLQANGFNPVEHPNTKLLTHSDVVRIFVPSARSSAKTRPRHSGLPASARCLRWAGVRCSQNFAGPGWCNFLTDFGHFHRRTETTGWRFHGLILVVNDDGGVPPRGGQPRVNEVETTSNLLGPLQDGPPLLSIK